MRRRAALLASLAILFVGAACGGSAGESSGTDADGGAKPTSGDAIVGAVTFTAANGEVTLPGPAKRIVALEWVYAEDSMLLGVTPVGVADTKGYAGYVGAPPTLPGDVTDVGSRQDPSIEEIRALQPDLILGVAMRHDAILDDLEAIAPTALFDPYGSPQTQVEEMRSTFTEIATATGKQAEGEQVLAGLDAKIASAKTTLAPLSDDRRRIVVVQPYVANDVPVIRAFTSEALAVELFEQIGLVNVWTEPGDDYGFTTTDLEGLTTVTDASVLYTADADDIDKGGFVGNPLWEQWQPVVDGRLYPLGAMAWTYGGPASAEFLIDQAVAQLG